MQLKTRKRLALLILVLGVPAYIISAVVLMAWLFPDPLNRPSLLVELLIYVALGIVWALPLKRVFLGVAQAGPDNDG